MKLQKRNIRLDNDDYVCLNEQTLFKANGEEGLHLWESSILFSRFIKKNNNVFKNKKIIELGSGCGLLGISCLMFTDCAHLTFSDYQQSVLDNLLKNISLNNLNHKHNLSKENPSAEKNEKLLQPNCLGCFPDRYSVLNLDWRDYDQYKLESFDLVIGSELIYSGGHIEELAILINNLLKPDGMALIAMPEKRSMTNMFLKYLSENNLCYESKYFKDECEDIFDHVLENQKESKKFFEDLESMKIIMYTIKKIPKLNIV